MYHEPIGKDLDAGVAERGPGQLDVTEVAGKHPGRHGHDIVEHVHDDPGHGQSSQYL